MRALLEACSGQDFEDRRDTGLLMTLIDTGARASEVVGSGTRRPTLKPTTLIWTRRLLRVTGKGNLVRGLAIGQATVKAWDRYVRVQARRRDADLPGSG